jgi:hypothetical protein
MLKTLLIAAGLFAAGAAFADDLLPRLEAAQVAVDGRMLALSGTDPARAGWSPDRRAASACALRELERRRGRKTAETYVRAVEKAVGEAARLRSAGEFGGLAARIHRDAGIKLQRDLVPITQTCGIGL